MAAYIGLLHVVLFLERFDHARLRCLGRIQAARLDEVTHRSGTVALAGGLGGAVAEIVVENYPVPMKRIGIPDIYCGIGYFDELLEKNEMNISHIVEAAKGVIARS